MLSSVLASYSKWTAWTKVVFWTALLAVFLFITSTLDAPAYSYSNSNAPSFSSISLFGGGGGGGVEAFTQQDPFLFKTGYEIYDDFYANIYDHLVFNNAKDEYEVGEIVNSTHPSSQSRILDIGCGTGHHVAGFGSQGLNVMGIDISPSMVKKAKENYPKYTFQVGDAENGQMFSPNSFTHILCMYFTIYYFRNKRQFFQNCYQWLERGGFLIVHLVDPDKFDPILPPGNPLMWVSPQKYAKKRITTTKIQFDTFHYNSDFQYDPNTETATFVEKFRGKEGNRIRKNEHVMYMPSVETILADATAVGFDIQGKIDMLKAQYEDNYLYILTKPE